MPLREQKYSWLEILKSWLPNEILKAFKWMRVLPRQFISMNLNNRRTLLLPLFHSCNSFHVFRISWKILEQKCSARQLRNLVKKFSGYVLNGIIHGFLFLWWRLWVLHPAMNRWILMSYEKKKKITISLFKFRSITVFCQNFYRSKRKIEIFWTWQVVHISYQHGW